MTTMVSDVGKHINWLVLQAVSGVMRYILLVSYRSIALQIVPSQIKPCPTGVNIYRITKLGTGTSPLNGR